MTVAERMSAAVLTCTPDQSMHTPAQLMAENDASVVVVVDGHGRVVGTVTDRDLLFGAMRTARPLWGAPVRSCMRRDPAVIRGDARVEEAAALERRSCGPKGDR